MRSVGATKAQEVGYALAYALAYLDEALERGLGLDEIAPRFSFFFQCDSHFFEEAAKFRAARRVWYELVSSRYGTERRENLLLRATGVSAARCFTKEESEINLIRGAYSALGCALGGVQGMWISGYDEAYATPTARASRLALRTMQILAEETGVRATIDPLGGGFYIEHLTKLMAAQIHEHVREVEENGGAVAATSSGYLRQRMLENDLRWAHERERGERPIVGHNVYRLSDGGEAHEVEFQRFRQDVVDDQVRRLHEVRASRDAGEVEQSLQALRAAAAEGANVMPSTLACVRAYCTVGEIMDQLRAVHGEWSEPEL
jgi:methylmalonyl-CoA mutase N-terminal domain/subunit